MAILRTGNKNSKGKVGKKITYFLNGQLVTREVGYNGHMATSSQLAVRQKTKIITALLKPVKDFIDLGFSLQTKNKELNAHNVACSVNRLHAIIGEYPNQEIDFTKAVFSKGTISVNEKIMVDVSAIGLRFSWDSKLILPGMKGNDHIMLIAYCPEKRSAFCQLDGARRKEGMEEISLPRYHEKVTVHTYVAFIASDRKSISNSIYTGKLLW